MRGFGEDRKKAQGYDYIGKLDTQQGDKYFYGKEFNMSDFSMCDGYTYYEITAEEYAENKWKDRNFSEHRYLGFFFFDVGPLDENMAAAEKMLLKVYNEGARLQTCLYCHHTFSTTSEPFTACTKCGKLFE